MNIAALFTPFAARLMLWGIIALAGVLGVVWWSYSSQISRLTKERDAALVSVGVLTANNETVTLALERQNGFVAQLRIQADAALAQSAASLKIAAAASAVLAGQNENLRSRVLPTAPDAVCTTADALILEFVR